MKKLDVDKIYVVHYEKNRDRRSYLEPALAQYANEVEFCTYPCREELTQEVVDRYYIYDEAGRARATRLNRDFLPHMDYGFVATTIGHFEIFKKAAKETTKNCLVLEDDTVLCQNFELFNDFLRRTPTDYEAIFIGGGCDLALQFHHRPLVPGVIAYPRTEDAGRTRSADAIIYSKGLIEKMVQRYQTFTQPIDWELELMLRELTARVYWWEPNLVVQGSGWGVYQSNFLRVWA
ncbi:MAG: hypothetical protein Q8P93_01515 [bacterium]|nr:hypothetical protein [bacterium]